MPLASGAVSWPTGRPSGLEQLWGPGPASVSAWPQQARDRGPPLDAPGPAVPLKAAVGWPGRPDLPLPPSEGMDALQEPIAGVEGAGGRLPPPTDSALGGLWAACGAQASIKLCPGQDAQKASLSH